MRSVCLAKRVCLFAAAAFASGCALSADETVPRKELADIDTVIERALETFKVPGLAVAVVVGDDVVLSKGYGLRDVEKKLPMAAETQMPIASITKQFTVATLGHARPAGEARLGQAGARISAGLSAQ
jgi:CubicO group peptidase (beta-lactamase class C family)